MKILEILNILEKYMTESEKKWPFWTEHDVLGFTVDYSIISVEDMEQLKKLDVFYSSEYDSLIMFT
jgi:hypothetical protein